MVRGSPQHEELYERVTALGSLGTAKLGSSLAHDRYDTQNSVGS